MASTEPKTSSSSRSSYKHTGEERFPLLLQLLEEERPNSSCGCDSRSSNRVSNGVAMVLGRWPRNITTGCISAVFLSTMIIATIIMILTILVITTLHNNVGHRMILKRETALLAIETSCDYKEEEKRTVVHKTSKLSANVSAFDYIVLQNPLVVKRDVHNETNFQAKESLNAFFLTTEKLLSPYHVCSIESAARATPNLTFYLIILSSHDKKKPNSDKRFDQLSGIYKNIKLYHLMGEKYFYDSPIRGIFEKNRFEQSIIIFAARILTLWRYGGITFDMSLITTNNISRESFPIPHDYSVMLSDSEGTVMSVRMQCHSLLFEFLKTLAAFHKSEKYVITNQDIIEAALNSFCYNITMKRESPGLPICKGVSTMSNDLICNKISETALANTKCIWSSVNGSSLYIRQQLCPVAYHSQKTEEYKHANLIAHKRKVKFVT